MNVLFCCRLSSSSLVDRVVGFGRASCLFRAPLDWGKWSLQARTGSAPCRRRRGRTARLKREGNAFSDAMGRGTSKDRVQLLVPLLSAALRTAAIADFAPVSVFASAVATLLAAASSSSSSASLQSRPDEYRLERFASVVPSRRRHRRNWWWCSAATRRPHSPPRDYRRSRRSCGVWSVGSVGALGDVRVRPRPNYTIAIAQSGSPLWRNGRSCNCEPFGSRFRRPRFGAQRRCGAVVSLPITISRAVLGRCYDRRDVRNRKDDLKPKCQFYVSTRDQSVSYAIEFYYTIPRFSGTFNSHEFCNRVRITAGLSGKQSITLSS